ncbi:MAG: DUF1489 domain-containing protein [Alphaproteobacteria bacterium]|nr:DUF1489 domain-containing protein [Alphaproteobacteria bacterium]
MPLHLVKMAVGVDNVDHLATIQKKRKQSAKAKRLRVRTRNMPRRVEELLDGGSMYWIIKGYVRVRQRILAVERKQEAEGRSYCEIWLDPALVRTQLYPRKPQQGWRYLDDADAPADLGDTGMDENLPPEMAAELRELGLI